MSNPLSADNLLKQMAESLPTHKKDDTSSDFGSSYEALALFSHACMVALGFRLLGFGEGQKIESELKDTFPRLSQKWLASFNAYQFLYAHTQSSMEYKVTVAREGDRAVFSGIALGGEQRLGKGEFEITAKEYIYNAALPLRIKMTDEGEEDRSTLEAKLKEIFVSTTRLEDLASQFKLKIIQKIMPSLQKEGYEEEAAAVGVRAARDEREQELEDRRNPPPNRQPLPEPARPYPFNDPLAVPPRPRAGPDGFIPDFDDEYDMNRPLRGMVNPGGRPPFGIGHDDLNPPGLGPHDPLRGSFVPGGGFPGGGFPQGGGNGGMHPDFNDPMFGGQRPGFNPNAPPGARYDPPGPGQAPQGGSGRPHNPFGGFGSNDFI